MTAPKNGWMPVTVSSFGEFISFSASNAPFDSATELANANLSLLEGTEEVIVPWNAKFTAYDFSFTTKFNKIILSIVEFPNHLRQAEAGTLLFKITENKLEMCSSLTQSLHKLGKLLPSPEKYIEDWGHPFPSQVLKEIKIKREEFDPFVLRY